MANESLLWAWMQKEGKAFGDDLHMRRVENLVSVGDPDVNLCHDGYAADVELKGLDRPVRATTNLRIVFQPGQTDWLKRRWNAGGAAWLYLRVGKGIGQIKRYLVRGADAYLLEYPIAETDVQRLSAVEPVHSFADFLFALRR